MDNYHQDWATDHDHAPGTPGILRHLYSHRHEEDSTRTRWTDTVAAAPDKELPDLLYGVTDHNNVRKLVPVRTLNVWDDAGNLVHPCQVGHHAGLKYNVVQLHHKDPVGLGGPEVRLKWETCGWGMHLPGMAVCGMHHDDAHLLWRICLKRFPAVSDVNRPLSPPAGIRRQFGRKVIDLVEEGWALRAARLEGS